MRWIALLTLIYSCGAIPQEFVPEFRAQWIGHGLGKDLEGMKANDPKNIPIIKNLENHPRFRFWEFCVNSAKDKLVSVHDSSVGKVDIRDHKNSFWGLPRYSEIIDALVKAKPTKVVRVDLKVVKMAHTDTLFRGFDKLIKAGIRAEFYTSCARKNHPVPKEVRRHKYPIKYYKCEPK